MSELDLDHVALTAASLGSVAATLSSPDLLADADAQLAAVVSLGRRFPVPPPEHRAGDRSEERGSVRAAVTCVGWLTALLRAHPSHPAIVTGALFLLRRISWGCVSGEEPDPAAATLVDLMPLVMSAVQAHASCPRVLAHALVILTNATKDEDRAGYARALLPALLDVVDLHPALPGDLPDCLLNCLCNACEAGLGPEVGRCVGCGVLRRLCGSLYGAVQAVGCGVLRRLCGSLCRLCRLCRLWVSVWAVDGGPLCVCCVVWWIAV
jgi:hypothetical protein